MTNSETVRFCCGCNCNLVIMVLGDRRTRTRPTILLVEDYADSRQMLTLLLESMDYRVLPAANGREALAAAANNNVDLIVTDFNLPDITGPGVVRSVRQLGDQSAYIPAIILTAYDGDEYRELAAEACCEAFLVKPPDFDLLKATIDHHLQVSRSSKGIGRAEDHQVNSLRGSRSAKVDPFPTSL